MSEKLYRKRAIATSIALVLGTSLSMPLVAEEQDDKDEENVVVVTGFRGSLKENINRKRTANTVSDVITAEDIGKFPDKNVAESLSRITGVAVTREFGEGEKITIRGSGPSQNRTLLNGQNVGTADWFILDQPSRGFNYTLLPSSLVKSLEVFKSPEAKTDEGSLGGTVLLSTRRPLELEANSGSISLQGQYSDTSEKTDPQIDALYSWKNEDESFGALISLTKQDRTVRREGLEVLGWTPEDANGVRAPKDIGNPIFRQERERETVFVSLQYAASSRLDLTLNLLDSKMDANNANANLLIRPQNNYADLTNIALDGSNIVAGTVEGAGSYEWDFINRESSTETSSYDLDINYDGEGVYIHAQIGTTEAKGGTYKENSWGWGPSASIDSDDTGYSFDLRGTPSFNTEVPAADTSAWSPGWVWGGAKPTTDEEDYAQVDFEFDVDWNDFKSVETGLKVRSHTRGQGRHAFSWHAGMLYNGPATYPHYLAQMFGECPTLADCGLTTGTHSVAEGVTNGNTVIQLNGNQDAFTALAFGPNATYAIHDNLPEIWEVEEDIVSAYVQANFEGDNYRGNFGVRIVDTDQKSSSYEYSADSWGLNTLNADWLEPSVLNWVSEDRAYTEFLPSLNVAFNLTDDKILRLAAARVMARPNFSSLSPGVAIGALNVANPTATTGNPNLSPTIANQFDIGYEWYFDDAAIFAVTLFLKEIASYEVQSSYQDQFYDAMLDANIDTEVFFPVNGAGGTTSGIEIGFQQEFGDFGVAANYTYTDAENDGIRDESVVGSGLVAGASQHMFNATGFYEAGDFSVRLMYNYRSEWFNGPHWTGAELITEGFGQVDFSASYSLNESVDFVLEAVNLNNEKIVRYDGVPERLMSVYENGRRFVFGVNYSF